MLEEASPQYRRHFDRPNYNSSGPVRFLLYRKTMNLGRWRMSKKAKLSRPYRDGWNSARSEQGRAANPYPFSSMADRDEWFRGYDDYLRAAAE